MCWTQCGGVVVRVCHKTETGKHPPKVTSDLGLVAAERRSNSGVTLWQPVLLLNHTNQTAKQVLYATSLEYEGAGIRGTVGAAGNTESRPSCN